jgi:hypothetical protein
LHFLIALMLCSTQALTITQERTKNRSFSHALPVKESVARALLQPLLHLSDGKLHVAAHASTFKIECDERALNALFVVNDAPPGFVVSRRCCGGPNGNRQLTFVTDFTPGSKNRKRTPVVFALQRKVLSCALCPLTRCYARMREKY